MSDTPTPHPEPEERTIAAAERALASIATEGPKAGRFDYGSFLSSGHALLLHAEVQRLRAELADLRSVNASMNDDNDSLSPLVDENERLRASLAAAEQDSKRGKL